MAREQVLNEVWKMSTQQLAECAKDQTKYQQIIADLIVQGLLRLLEPVITIRCREMDKSLVEAACPIAAKKYTEILNKECGVTKTVKLTVDKSGIYLPPPPGDDNHGASCCGGIILITSNGRISCDNTFDSRLQMVIQECLPQIRKTLFPQQLKS